MSESSRAVATRGRQDDDDEDPRVTALTTAPVMALTYDAQQLVQGVSPEIAAKWIYDISAGGQDDDGNALRIRGIGGQGAQEGVRLLAGKGEIIRVEECVIVDQNADEAFFQATAARYVMSPETGEVRGPFDTTTRGKRVPKYIERRGGVKGGPDKDWYSKGLTKATRNVILAMLPGNVKTAILGAGLAAQGALPPAQRQRPTGRTVRQSPPAQPIAPPVTASAIAAAPADEAAVMTLLQEAQQAVSARDLLNLWQEIDKVYPNARKGGQVTLGQLTPEERGGLAQRLHNYLGHNAAPPAEEPAAEATEPAPAD